LVWESSREEEILEFWSFWWLEVGAVECHGPWKWWTRKIEEESWVEGGEEPWVESMVVGPHEFSLGLERGMTKANREIEGMRIVMMRKLKKKKKKKTVSRIGLL